jgi:ABC-type phosphate/phosphonate transport system substrate-binding protein
LGSLPNTSSSSLATQESKPAVRKEKIIEALKSENQRGKKRQDLNDMERLELTRTRNREHAKSTRYVDETERLRTC